MEAPLGSDIAQPRGRHEPGLRHPDGGQRPLQIMRPEIQELDQFGIAWRQVVVLPDIGLQNVTEVRHVVGDFRRSSVVLPLPISPVITVKPASFRMAYSSML